VAGRFDPRDLERTDSRGVAMAEAVQAFGGDPSKIGEDRWSGDRPLGYVEVHIEQGPVLESLGLPVGVVSAIAGQSRFEITFTGEAGHAGTVPLAQRRDALVGASIFVEAVDAVREKPGLVATVGRLSVRPGAANVIPGEVTLSLDVRSPEDEEREAECEILLRKARAIARDRRLEVSVAPVSARAAV